MLPAMLKGAVSFPFTDRCFNLDYIAFLRFSQSFLSLPIFSFIRLPPPCCKIMSGTRSLSAGNEFLKVSEYDNNCFEVGLARTSKYSRTSAPQNAKILPLDHLSYLGKLGNGSQGSVYLVHDNRTNERLALKAITIPELPTTFDICAVMLERNSIIHAQRHNVSGVTRVKEMFHDSGVCYILMQLGHTSLHKENKGWKNRMPVYRIRSILYDLACTLKEMHAVNMIHRDVKPDNILIDRKGRAWLTDLGMAHCGPKFAQGSCGTYEYMAPEVKSGSYYDGRADVWSLGVLLYRLVFGRYPFTHEDRCQIPEVALTTSVRIDPGEISADAEDLLKRMLIADSHLRLSMEDVINHPFFQSIRNCTLERFIARKLFKAVRRPYDGNYTNPRPMRDQMRAQQTPDQYFPDFEWIAKDWTIDPDSVILLPAVTHSKRSHNDDPKRPHGDHFSKTEYFPDRKFTRPTLIDTNSIKKVPIEYQPRPVEFSPFINLSRGEPEPLPPNIVVTSASGHSQADARLPLPRRSSRLRPLSSNQPRQPPATLLGSRLEHESKAFTLEKCLRKAPQTHSHSVEERLAAPKTSTKTRAEPCVNQYKHSLHGATQEKDHSHKPKFKDLVSFFCWASLRHSRSRNKPAMH